MKDCYSEQSSTTANIMSNSTKYWLISIIAIGIILRLMAAYIQPTFLDEGYVFNTTKFDIATIVQEMRRDSHPPTYNFLIYPLVHSSDNIFLLRLPGVVTGGISIWLGFMLGCRLGDKRVGLVLASLLATIYNIWILDAQLRSYGMLDCALLGLLIMVIDVHHRSFPLKRAPLSRDGWLEFFLIATLCASLHLTGYIAVGCFALILLSLAPRRYRAGIILLIGLIPSTCWFIYVQLAKQNFLSSPHALSTNFNELIDLPSYLLGWQIFPRYAQTLLNNLANQWHWDVAVPLASAIFIALYTLSLLLAWWMMGRGIAIALNGERHSAIIAIIPVLAQIAMLLASNIAKIQVLQKRHLLPFAPNMLIFIAIYICAINSDKMRRTLSSLILGSCIITALLFPIHTPLWNQNWRGAINFINSRLTGNDIVLLYHNYAYYSFVQTYAPGQILFDPVKGKIILSKEYKGPTILPLMRSTANENMAKEFSKYNIFVVLNQYRYENAKDHLYDWLSSNFQCIDSYHEDSYTDWAIVDVQQLRPQ